MDIVERLKAEAPKAVACEHESFLFEAAVEIKKQRRRADEMAAALRALTPIDQLPVRKLVSFETAEFIYS